MPFEAKLLIKLADKQKHAPNDRMKASPQFALLLRGVVMVQCGLFIAQARSKAELVDPSSTGMEADSGFLSLFNGHDLSGWSGDPRIWEAADGAIIGRISVGKRAQGNCLIWTNGTVADFELRFSFRVPRGNSGIAYRAKDFGNWELFGYQYVITDMASKGGEIGQLFEHGAKGNREAWVSGRGHLGTLGTRVSIRAGRAISGDGAPAATAEQALEAIRVDEWNEGRIIAEQGHVTHLINGVVATEVHDLDVIHRSLSGVVGLEIDPVGKDAAVQFKDIRLKPIHVTEEHPVQPGKASTSERLKQLKSLYDQGLISKEDYQKKTKEIMDSL